jgi:D-arabinose 1-dehydrogenase-like Zn-dependent alcohol dehydrogenase
MSWKKKLQPFPVIVSAFGLLLAGGCAATNGTVSNQKIWQANKAIGEAKESNAILNAPDELKAAEDKIVEATTALTNKDYERAVRLAEEASINAEYARARAAAEKAKKAAEEMRQTNKDLRQELERMPQP